MSDLRSLASDFKGLSKRAFVPAPPQQGAPPQGDPNMQGQPMPPGDPNMQGQPAPQGDPNAQPQPGPPPGPDPMAAQMGQLVPMIEGLMQMVEQQQQQIEAMTQKLGESDKKFMQFEVQMQQVQKAVDSAGQEMPGIIAELQQLQKQPPQSMMMG